LPLHESEQITVEFFDHPVAQLKCELRANL
jgi:hypothetical protein